MPARQSPAKAAIHRSRSSPREGESEASILRCGLAATRLGEPSGYCARESSGQEGVVGCATYACFRNRCPVSRPQGSFYSA